MRGRYRAKSDRSPLRWNTTSQNYHRRLRCEPLEDRRLLSVAGADEALSGEAIQMFHTQDALFAENAGQWAVDDVYFGYNKGGTQIYFTDDSLEFGLSRTVDDPTATPSDPTTELAESPATAWELDAEPEIESTHFSLSFNGARATVPVGADMAETVFNYQLGEQSSWVDSVATYKTVIYNGLYDGIDLHTFSRHGQMKYEFHIAPGSDYTQIELSYDGIEGLSISADGSLHIATELGELVDEDLYIYQEIGGQQTEIAGQFMLLDNDTYAFTVTGQYDPSLELVIDPELDWSTYMGGHISTDYGRGVAVDAGSNTIVAGWTYSPGWVSGGFDENYDGSWDGFVAKLSPSGGHLWSTYLGGDNVDHAEDVATDAQGNVYVCGKTRSSDWGVFGGWDTTFGGDYDDYDHDGFVVKLSATGDHLWSTYLGDDNVDEANGIAVDASGNVLVSGTTHSYGWISGGFDTSYGGNYGNYVSGDGFVVKLSSIGGHLWSTYLGGSDIDRGHSIDVDALGNAWVTGLTVNAGWVSGGFDTSYNGGRDIFVVKISSSGSHLWSTYLGGSHGDQGNDIAVDTSGNALVTGYTSSGGWVTGGFDITFNGRSDPFVVMLNAMGEHLWSTYLGGNDEDGGISIALDISGNVWVTGVTESVGWVSGGFDTSYNGGAEDAFLTKLSATGDHLWSTYLGGSDQDRGYGVDVDDSGNASVTGWTESAGWVSGGFDTSYNGGRDIFVAKISDVPINDLPEIASLSLTPVIDENESAELMVQFVDADLLDEHTVRIDWGDGTVDNVTLAVGEREFSSAHPYLDDGPSGIATHEYTVSVTVSDELADDSESAVVTVSNLAPLVDPIVGPTPGPGVVGQTLAFSAGFSDPGTLDTHEVEWDFGDGTVIPFQSTDVAGALAPTHVYAAAGTFVVTVTIRDDDLGSSSQTKDVTIGSVALQDDPLYPGDTMLVVSGTDEDDHIVFAPKGKTAGVKVILNGTPLGVFEPTSRIVAFGLGGNDHIHVAGSIDLPAWLYGGTGDDWLYGGRGNDLLFGELGNDLLFGKQGRDLMVGGPGSDRLVGNGDDDILIAGYLELAETDETLRDLMGVWTSRQWDHATRLAMLDDILVAGDTVKNDDDRDVLIGSSGEDWFFHELGRDVVVGRRR